MSAENLSSQAFSAFLCDRISIASDVQIIVSLSKNFRIIDKIPRAGVILGLPMSYFLATWWVEILGSKGRFSVLFEK